MTEYDVDAPIWGDMYGTTVSNISDLGSGFDLSAMVEPRIEPEIVFGLSRGPEPGMAGWAGSFWRRGNLAAVAAMMEDRPMFRIVHVLLPMASQAPAEAIRASLAPSNGVAGVTCRRTG